MSTPKTQRADWWTPTGQLQLTGSLDGDFELAGSGSFGVNLEVRSLLHSQAFGLQATTFGPAQAGVAGCGQAAQCEGQAVRGAGSSPTRRSVASSSSSDKRRCGVGGTKLTQWKAIGQFWRVLKSSDILFLDLMDFST